MKIQVYFSENVNKAPERKEDMLFTWKDFHTALNINFSCITVKLNLFQKRIELESQNACIIIIFILRAFTDVHVWDCVETLPLK